MERRALAITWLHFRIGTETSADIISMDRRGGVASHGGRRGGQAPKVSTNRSIFYR
jgi:hypothetical protein